MMTRGRFKRISPTIGIFGSDAYPILSGALSVGAYSFCPVDEPGHFSLKTPDISEIEEVLDFVERELGAMPWPSSSFKQAQALEGLEDFLLWGATFIDWRYGCGSEELPAIKLRLSTGRTVGEREILAALVLVQCEQVAAAIDSMNTKGAVILMWDIHEIADALRRVEGDNRRCAEARALSVRMNERRHERRNRARALACAEWERDRNRFPSAEKAGIQLAAWLREQEEQYEFEPRTVTTWVRDHARSIGTRFR